MRYLVLMPLLLLGGCVNTDYAGVVFAPTTRVDVYFADEPIERDFELMGKAQAESPNTISYEKMEEKLVETAMANGADAIIILNATKVPVEEVKTQSIAANTTGGSSQAYYFSTKAGMHRGSAARWQGRPYTTEAKNKVLRADFIKYR